MSIFITSKNARVTLPSPGATAREARGVERVGGGYVALRFIESKNSAIIVIGEA